MKIEINGIDKEVIVTRKKIKNMILRVNEHGEICVSCPVHVTDRQILSFLNEKKTWILKSEKLQKKKKNQMQYGADGEVTWFGKTYPAIVKQENKNSVEFKEDTFVFSLCEDDEGIMFEGFYSYGAEYLAIEIKKLRKMLDEKICIQNGKRCPKITLKYMTSRWGSCTPGKSHISISMRLIHFPKQCLEYVLIHEYVHILIPNHSKDFYAKVGEFMPDYKIYKDMLNH